MTYGSHPRTLPRRLLVGAAGLVLGIVAGTAFALAIVVVRAALFRLYLQELEAVLGWPGLPIALGALAGAWLGWRGRLWGAAAGGLVAGALGLGLGVLLGRTLPVDPTGPWIGGIVGAALGILVGAVLARLPPGRRAGAAATRALSRVPGGRRTVAAALIVGAALVLSDALAEGEAPPPLPEPGSLPSPDTASVTAALFFAGDAGLATLETSPPLARLRADVERWSAALGAGGEVAVVYLGDIIYPNGMSAPDDPAFAQDSARLDAQVRVVDGAAAKAAGARAIFVMGNHDWGPPPDWEDATRVLRLAEFVERRRAEGAAAFVEPAPGTGGPTVIDIGEHVRLVLLDTAWWLVEADPAGEQALVRGVEAALAGAGGREVVVAAHHPFASGGTHGTFTEIGSTLGIRLLLSRSGALLQDLHSDPYRELLRALEAVFVRTGPPTVFVGGHDHSLQVLDGVGAAEPRLHVVSGSMSKLSGVGVVPATQFARAVPGYAVLLVRSDGALELRIEAAPAGHQSCDGAGDVQRCMQEGVGAFRTVWVGKP